ncbi:uncharacterized protein JCM15063_003499 [Sporobolomyces koalae]|uniref:uncharacterized protein n=1 Tax=Sporobolomyces koalae TaxID=500713 RepID=UPI003181F729
MATEDAKREKQSKALGAAFLAHQVSQLEKSVDTLTFSRDSRISARRTASTRASGAATAGSARPGSRPVRVVDASTLVHALPVLKRWVRQDKYQLVIPLAALSTLDILKKAPPPLNDQARDATRFIESQLDIARQIQAAWTGADADARIRVRAQRANEELPWNQVEKKFSIPHDYQTELPLTEAGQPLELPPTEEGEEPYQLPLPTANDIPRNLRSSLQCVLYFDSLDNKKSVPTDPTVAVYNSLLETPPPVPAELAALVHAQRSSSSSTSSSRKPTQPTPIDFVALSSGDALQYYLSTFFPTVSAYSISSSEVVAATEWFKAQARAQLAARDQSGNAIRGGGGGGKGGRSRGSETRGNSGTTSAGGRTSRQVASSGSGGTSSTSTAKTLFVP